MSKTRIQHIAAECARIRRLMDRESQPDATQYVVTADDVKSELFQYVEQHMPSGSGIDSGTKIDLDASNGETKVVFKLEFHHMDDMGHYCEWTVHEVIVRPSFDGIDMKITGPDRRQIKDHLYDTYRTVLTETHE